MNLHQACDIFLNHCDTEKNLSPRTLRAYRCDLNSFAASVGPASALQGCSEKWIEDAMQRWHAAGTLKASTLKRRVACIKVLLRWLYFKRLIERNPFERLQIDIRLPKRLPRHLQTDELRKLVAVKPETAGLNRLAWDKLTARLAIEVLCLTGVRIGELVKIRLSDIDCQLRQILISGKGNKERHVVLPDDVTMQRLQRYRSQISARFPAPPPQLFLNGLGRPANEQYLRRVIRCFAEDADLGRHVTPHMLRHTAATQLLEAGVDIRFLQKLLGHASITTTELYTHVGGHALRNEITRANVRKRLEKHR